MHQIIIQNVSKNQYTPHDSTLLSWAKGALSHLENSHEVTIRLVDVDEMTTLNTTYRKKKGPTNVLSFPADLPEDIPMEHALLGDIIICAKVVNDEACKQGIEKDAHWAHMVVHGCLHLLGYDHEEEKEAKAMEGLEVNILKKLGFKNPYDGGETIQAYD